MFRLFMPERMVIMLHYGSDPINKFQRNIFYLRTKLKNGYVTDAVDQVSA